MLSCLRRVAAGFIGDHVGAAEMVLMEIFDAGGIDFGHALAGRENVFYVLPGHAVRCGLLEIFREIESGGLQVEAGFDRPGNGRVGLGKFKFRIAGFGAVVFSRGEHPVDGVDEFYEPSVVGVIHQRCLTGLVVGDVVDFLGLVETVVIYIPLGGGGGVGQILAVDRVPRFIVLIIMGNAVYVYFRGRVGFFRVACV